MLPINLFTFLQINRSHEIEVIEKYFQHLSKSSIKTNICIHEFDSLKALTNCMLDKSPIINEYNGFYYSFTIPRIGKEFDLLKMDENKILNIELKSCEVSEESILAQLLKNKVYLNALGLELYQFTYISENNKVYKLEDGNLIDSSIDDLIDINKSMGNYITSNLNDLFHPSKYLTSPVNEVQSFALRKYILTNHQDVISKEIISYVKNQANKIIGLSGGAGTGKTLLTYHIAGELINDGYRVLIIHTGLLNDGHLKLNKKYSYKIKPIKNILLSLDFSKYDLIIIDEAHRLINIQYDKFLENIETTIVFSYDDDQTISKKEESYKISEKINKNDSIIKYSLTNKIRTNDEILGFIESLKNVNIPYNYDNKNVSVYYSQNLKMTKHIIEMKRQNGFIFINYTSSLFNTIEIDQLHSDYNCHEVIGQEFDNVIVIMGNEFKYESGILKAENHSNPDYLYIKMLYQALTRAREQICIVVWENKELFNNIISIENFIP